LSYNDFVINKEYVRARLVQSPLSHYFILLAAFVSEGMMRRCLNIFV